MSATVPSLPFPRAGAHTAPEARWLAEVKVRAWREVLWLRHRWQAHHYADEHLLAITHSEVDRVLTAAAGEDAERQRFLLGDPHARALADVLAELEERPEDGRLAHLIDTFALTPSEAALLRLGLAAALEPGLARVFGYLLDLTEAADPTPGLARALFGLHAGSPPAPDSPLVRWHLAVPASGREVATAWHGGWRIDPMLAASFAAESPPDVVGTPGAAGVDWSPGTSGERVLPGGPPVLRADVVEELVAFAGTFAGRADVCLEIELIGPAGSGRTQLAARVAAGLGRPLIAVDAAAVAAAPDPLASAVREARRARLEGAVLAWLNPQVAPPEMWRAVPSAPLTLVCTESPAELTLWPDTVRRSIRVPSLTRGDRLALWASLSEAPAPAAVRGWLLRPAEVVLAARVAAAGADAVSAVLRRLLLADHPDLLTRMPLPYEWDDLVLARGTLVHLREIEARARTRDEVLDGWGFARLTPLGRGTTALFAGPSGTGKTMAAQVLARALGLELLRVDLAGVVNKYIGETEKHLREVFDVCERAPSLLLFDEADALFGKRSQVSDAHDRYANIEIDYLLQRMEQFDGVAVLTTNRKGDLDSAFVRRLRFIVDFAPPSARERELLWRHALAGAADEQGRPLVEELDWGTLARELDLTGAGIKSAALAAAFLARADGRAIGAHHVLAAARRELEKQGTVVRAGQLEPR